MLPIRFRWVRYLGKGKTFRAARISVRRHAGTFDGFIRLKEGPNRFLWEGEIQIACENILHASVLVI